MTMPVAPEHEPFWRRHQREHEVAAAQTGALLEQFVAHIGGLRAALLAPPADDVLFSGVVKIGADGTYRFGTFRQPYASVMVLNSGAHAVTLLPDYTGVVPSAGAGMARVASGHWRLVSMRGTGLVLVGTTGTTLDVEVYMRHREPGAGTWTA